DDGLASDYIARLRRAAVAMAGYPNFAYSRPRGAVVTLYKDQAPQFYQLNQLFHAAGCACRLNRRNMTIFSYGHFALRDRFPALIDNSGTGHLALKLQDHDSENLDRSEQARRGHHAMTETAFSRLLEDQFPFIDLDTISGLR
ncbi:MAG: putative rhamnosyl transferase, partial [Alphaproteobacteria bacterium]|nr:putative rhamnosyl transferase [Alphaproteobacteria bacterium]